MKLVIALAIWFGLMLVSLDLTKELEKIEQTLTRIAVSLEHK